MRPILDMVLDKARISRRFLFDICYSSYSMLGLGFDNLYIHQECD